jgi:hypothetical protein
VPIDDRTSTQNYPKPNIANTLADDVGRLRTALDDIDADMAAKAPLLPIAETQSVISSNYEISTGSNGLSVGPVEVAATYAVTVPANATWLIAV